MLQTLFINQEVKLKIDISINYWYYFDIDLRMKIETCYNNTIQDTVKNGKYIRNEKEFLKNSKFISNIYKWYILQSKSKITKF